MALQVFQLPQIIVLLAIIAQLVAVLSMGSPHHLLQRTLAQSTHIALLEAHLPRFAQPGITTRQHPRELA